MMKPEDRTQYLQLAAELAGIATRLKMLADAGWQPQEPVIVNALCSLLPPSETVARASMAIREFIEATP